MKTSLEPFRAFVRAHGIHRKGQTLVEYSLILAIISITLIAAFSVLGSRIVIIFSAVANLLDSVQSSH